MSAGHLGHVTTRERPIDRGRRIARQDRQLVGRELRTARLGLGRSQAEIGAASGMSPSQVGRIERGDLPTVSLDQVARVGAAVGLDVRVRTYAGADPLMDAGHVALLGRLKARLHANLDLRFEVPLPLVRDQRAWDGMIVGLADAPGSVTGMPVEAEVRFVDAQAQTRRIALKCRDAGLDHVILLVADTRATRETLGAAASYLAADFPISARHALRALASGRHPGGSTILVL